MNSSCRKKWLLSAGLGWSLALVTGCQTWVPEAGMTMPSGDYLKHPPQYIPRSPDFPLQKELTSLQEASARQNGGPLGP